jgi:nitrite reductase/ring-hydroxylating ferredoxin subunit
VPIGTWLSATLLDLTKDSDAQARRLTAAGVLMSMPAAVSGATDWSEQHEQQMRVGVVHALANVAGLTCYGASLLTRNRRTGRQLRLAGLAAVVLGGKLGGYISFRLAGGANHSEAVPHIVEPSWQSVATESELDDGKPVRRMLGEVPVVLVKNGSSVHALADRCSHMSGSLAEGELSDGCLTCPWHGSTFSVQDGSVIHGPATSPQPSFLTRVLDGQVQVCLPGAG